MKKLVSQILAVVVVYEKSISESRSYQTLSPLIEQGLTLLVFDNSPTTQEAPETIMYHHSRHNEGVSGAYNFAAQKAIQSGKTWLWLLDDDTLVDPDFVKEVSTHLQAGTSAGLYVPRILSRGKLLSPFHMHQSLSKRMESIKPGLHPIEYIRPINSGMLIQTDLLQQAGGYSTSLPLDFSDIEFTDRLKDIQETMYVTKAFFEQNFSGDERPPLAKAKQRFAMYARSASVYAKTVAHPYHLRKQVLKRALRLSLQYFSPYFMAVFLKTSFTE